VINDELRAIQSVLNETARAGNEGAVPATLIVGGQVITGFIVSQRAYQRAREAAAADDLTRRVAAALNKVDSASPEASRKLLHIYLRGARFVLPDIRLGSSVLKIAIDAIDGFMFGVEGDDEGLVLGRAPVLPGAAESGLRSQAAVSEATNGAKPIIAESSCEAGEFAAILRRVANAVEAGETFGLMLEGEQVSVPAGGAFVIEHEGEGEGEGEGISFRIRWKGD
jgi:hypothetical protein